MVHAVGQGIYAGKSCCYTLPALLGQEPLLMWTQMAELVATSDHYFITNASTTTNLAAWAFAQTEAAKKKKKSNFNTTRNYYTIVFSHQQGIQEHFNILTCSELPSLTPEKLFPNTRLSAFSAPVLLHSKEKQNISITFPESRFVIPIFPINCDSKTETAFLNSE